jgi:hypothetical protein
LSDNNSILAVWNAHYLQLIKQTWLLKFVPSVPGGFTDAERNDWSSKICKSINALNFLKCLESNWSKIQQVIVYDFFTTNGIVEISKKYIKSVCFYWGMTYYLQEQQ